MGQNNINHPFSLLLLNCERDRFLELFLPDFGPAVTVMPDGIQPGVAIVCVNICSFGDNSDMKSHSTICNRVRGYAKPIGIRIQAGRRHREFGAYPECAPGNGQPKEEKDWQLAQV